MRVVLLLLLLLLRELMMDVVGKGRVLGHGSVGRGTVFIAVFVFTRLLLDGSSTEDLDLSTEDHLETLVSNGLVHPWEASAASPFVEFATEGVGFLLEIPEFTGGEETVTTRGVDVGDGAVDDGRLAGATDLGEVGEQSGEILIITSLSACARLTVI